VLGGAAAIEQAAKRAGHDVQVPFTPGRTDASQAQTDVQSFAALEPTADGFRNYFGPNNRLSPAEMLVERANLLTLTVPEMTVLVGGMRARASSSGRPPRRPGVRFELRAARGRGGLRGQRRTREVREGLRHSVEQGHGVRPLYALMPTERAASE